mmetsp:Transcript_3482/g.8309  ORF Transcript_3482/g.8309 Transcript_3482/m.8309 type:complete len:395 (+) Transcript_3482:3258-4442(+)
MGCSPGGGGRPHTTRRGGRWAVRGRRRGRGGDWSRGRRRPGILGRRGRNFTSDVQAIQGRQADKVEQHHDGLVVVEVVGGAGVRHATPPHLSDDGGRQRVELSLCPACVEAHPHHAQLALVLAHVLAVRRHAVVVSLHVAVTLSISVTAVDFTVVVVRALLPCKQLAAARACGPPPLPCLNLHGRLRPGAHLRGSLPPLAHRRTVPPTSVPSLDLCCRLVVLVLVGLVVLVRRRLARVLLLVLRFLRLALRLGALLQLCAHHGAVSPAAVPCLNANCRMVLLLHLQTSLQLDGIGSVTATAVARLNLESGLRLLPSLLVHRLDCGAVPASSEDRLDLHSSHAGTEVVKAVANGVSRLLMIVHVVQRVPRSMLQGHVSVSQECSNSITITPSPIQ